MEIFLPIAVIVFAAGIGLGAKWYVPNSPAEKIIEKVCEEIVEKEVEVIETDIIK